MSVREEVLQNILNFDFQICIFKHLNKINFLNTYNEIEPLHKVLEFFLLSTYLYFLKKIVFFYLAMDINCNKSTNNYIIIIVLTKVLVILIIYDY